MQWNPNKSRWSVVGVSHFRDWLRRRKDLEYHSIWLRQCGLVRQEYTLFFQPSDRSPHSSKTFRAQNREKCEPFGLFSAIFSNLRCARDLCLVRGVLNQQQQLNLKQLITSPLSRLWHPLSDSTRIILPKEAFFWPFVALPNKNKNQSRGFLQEPLKLFSFLRICHAKLCFTTKPRLPQELKTPVRTTVMRQLTGCFGI